MPGFPNDSGLCCDKLTDTHTHHRKPFATLRSHVAWQHSLLCRISVELAKTTPITTATCYTRNMEAGQPGINSDWSPGITMEDIFLVLHFLFSEEFALHSQHCQAGIALVIRCQGRISAQEGVGWSQRAKLVKPYLNAWNTIFPVAAR